MRSSALPISLTSFILVKKPSVPTFTPNTGMSSFLAILADFNIVPSPPKDISMSNVFLKLFSWILL